MKLLTWIAWISLLPYGSFAMPTDVPSGAWYTNAVEVFVKQGYLPRKRPFLPGNKATRAEFVELLANLQDGSEASSKHSFDDVPPHHPYHALFEKAAKNGWLTGTNNCYGSRPCYASPDAPINRAEAAALMMRATNKEPSTKAPKFSDNPEGKWFTEHINNAASVCLLQGDANATTVRPDDHMNRAEMLTMLYRLYAPLQYPNCDATLEADIPLATTMIIQETAKKETWEGFEGPYGIHIYKETIYIMDSVAGKVLLFDNTGKQTGTLTAPGMEFPHGLAIDQNNLHYVADHRAGKVFIFDASGNHTGIFNKDVFTGPVHVHITEQQHLWVTDYKANRVLEFTLDGTLVREIVGEFLKPHMTVTDRDGNVYVVEVANNRIQKFSADGKLLSQIGTGVKGDDHGSFHNPTAIDIEEDTLYITDTDNNRIEVYDRNGTYLYTIGNLLSPFHAVEHNGKVYIVNTGTKQIKIVPKK